MNDRKTTTPAECAELLALKLSTIDALVHQKRIPHVKLGRALRFRREDIEEWIERQTRKPRCMQESKIPLCRGPPTFQE